MTSTLKNQFSSPTALVKSSCYFQFTISSISQISDPVFSPPFASSANTFWQLKFIPVSIESPEYCSLALYWVRNPEERRTGSISSERLKLNQAWLFVKDPESGTELERKLVKVSAFQKRWPGQGWARFIQKKKLGDKATFGVEFPTFSINQKEVHLLPQDSFPSDLRDAWSSQLDNPLNADVHFNINGHSLYASSIILSKRSTYFENMFQGEWVEVKMENNFYPESTVEPVPSENEGNAVVTTTPVTSAFKFNIDVTDYSVEIFRNMLVFLYTDTVPFKEGANQLENAVEIYSIADKYLISELRRRALQKIWECLTDDNAAEILFTFGSQWPDLKETVMEYVVTRFKSVRKTEGYLRIEKNNMEYPGASAVYAELLQKLIPDD
ncbi:8170_t:CDS:2 [Acaulospora morrowiae]|uniref:8170_t:CDS:1 n=1 Tax=Acaulospora morrowiae TaxID=94023 RepID=A0A9N9AB86_9GLOM|nr:8170_t:CDS:2 [Acaulospora morrowiae]